MSAKNGSSNGAINIKNRIKTIVENTTLLYNELKRLGSLTDDFLVYPTKTNFVFVKTSFGKDLWEYLKSNSVAVRYKGDYVRITAGTKKEIKAVISLIEKYFGEKLCVKL